MLSLLTLMSLGMYYASKSASQTSAIAKNSTEAYYYTETAINYVSWGLANDAEFDSYNYAAGTYQHGAFNEPPTINSNIDGDYREWGSYLWHPGPTVKNSDLGNGITGQVKYFDNSPMKDRTICFEDADVFSNCIDVTLSSGDAKRTAADPTMYQISVNLPRYIKLEISPDGSISPSIPKLPHHSSPVPGEDIPVNGAIVWLTAADPNNPNRDVEIFPLDPAGLYPVLLAPNACAGGTMADTPPACPCDYSTITLSTDVACDAHGNANVNPASPVVGGAYSAPSMGKWIPTYKLVAYAIGYVNGRPSHLIRSVIR